MAQRARGEVTYGEGEAEQLVVKLAKEGLSPSIIGMRLRDRYGIPSIQDITGKSITAILEENDLAPDIPEDLSHLMENATEMREHLAENPKDAVTKKTLQETEAQIRALAQYYRENDMLPEDWKYKPEQRLVA